jgi:cytochrome c oxidase cbb3-type subunit I/II
MEEVHYNDDVVRKFLGFTVLWGIVGMLVGVWIAILLAFPELNFGIGELSFGRLRPLHTNAVIFAFVGNMIFAGIYHSSQRLLKARMASDLLSNVHLWGWQLIIVAAAITLPLGITQSKEYAELEWPIDLMVVVVWVAFAINFFWTIAKRREKHLYVALWFYIATIVTVAVLYLVNNLAIPVFGAGIKSYGVFAGVQDALVQWWYGHNAVAFFLTTPVLGIMYYYLPKAADRPVYSYRLSIIHFWALIFMYIWAGPHHLLYTALPEWAQSMGMVFSLMLWAPSWGGMLNGLLTLRGAWDRVRREPVLKFLVAGVTFYGMSTFEGPLLSIKAVSSLAHYTDWIIGHVHSGALGWNGFMAAGLLYWLVPRLYGTKLYSEKAADAHFWMGTFGILLYAVAMWVSGITQGLMWRAITPEGALQYPGFVETLIAIRPLYMLRLIGGTLYIVGIFVMAWNLMKTVAGQQPVQTTIQAPALPPGAEISGRELLTSRPMILTFAAVIVATGFFIGNAITTVVFLCLLVGIGIAAWFVGASGIDTGLHRILEGRPLLFSVLSVVAILVGGIVEIVPTVVREDKAETLVGPRATPYRPLELVGRDIYVREGCYTCHSQMIRPMLMEKLRYGEPSTAGEFIYDHPFQWGSKRTGPDLHRTGGKMPNLWHWQHMMDPRSTSPGSNMPSYRFLADREIDASSAAARMEVMKTLGVPYSDAEVQAAGSILAMEQAAIVADLKKNGVEANPNSELVALIAYLQRLGKHPENPLAITEVK